MDISSDAVEAVLAHVRIFQVLDAAQRKAITDRLEVRRVPAGTCLFRLGDPGDEMYVVLEGAIEIDTHDKFGQKIVLATAGHGDMLGELSLIDEGARNATAIASQDCTLLVMTRDDLVDIVHRNPKASLEMMAILAERIRETHDRLRMLAARNANAAIETHETRLERATDIVAGWFGSLSFLAIHGGIFSVWIVWNVVAASPFDPYPFGLLTMAVSLEAILLSIMVLLSQNRQSARDHIRSDVEYEVNVTAGLQIAELHSKLDTMYAAMLARLARIERAASGGLPRTAADS
jgi:CRP/FNR family cyclic AMP-dependent transcriptional regulator